MTAAFFLGGCIKYLDIMKYCLILVSVIFIFYDVHAQSGAWTKKSNIPTPRVGAAVCVFDNRIYVIGGMSSYLVDTDVNEVYDPSTDTWETKRHMPTKRSFLLTCVINDTIYAIAGGYPYATKKVEVYDPITNAWSQKTDMPYPWFGVYGDVVNGKIYSIGGNYDKRNCFEFDPSTDKWTEKTPVPKPACAGPLSATTYNGLLYAFGGTANYPFESPDPKLPLSAVCAYNPQTDSWESKKNMPTPRYALGTFLVNEKIYAIGGSQERGSSLSTVEVYDPISDTWGKKSNMPNKNSWFRGTVINNKIYIIGGSPDWISGPSEVWEYDPSSDPTDVEQEIMTPTKFVLYQNYPNPFNPSTKIRYAVGSREFVNLKAFDVLGNEVATLVNEEKPTGTYEVKWNAAVLPSGVYFYQLKAGSLVETKKMIFLK